MLNTDFKLCSKLIAEGHHKRKNVSEIILGDTGDLSIHIIEKNVFSLNA